MSGLIPDDQKKAMDDVFDDIHDTFAREITMFKKEKQVFVATNNTYNALYSRIKNEKGSSKVVEEVKIKARIAYAGNFEFLRQNSENEIMGIDIPSDHIRIKLNKEGYDILKQATDIEIDGELFNVSSDPAKSGMFSVKYYNILLKRRS
jgi:hypothetical protein